MSLTISRSLPKFMLIAQWCHPAISSSDALSSYCPQSFPASGNFPMSHLFVSGDQNTGTSISASVVPVNIQGWSPLRLAGLKKKKINWFYLLPVQGTFRNLLQHHSLKTSVLWHSAFFKIQLSQLYMTTGKTIAFTVLTFIGRVMSLLFNTLSGLNIAFLPRSNHLISWLQSPSQ